MLITTESRPALPEHNTNLTRDDFTSGCEVVIERRVANAAEDASHTFTLSGECRFIPQENLPYLAPSSGMSIVAGWEDVPDHGRTFLVGINSIEDRLDHHTWFAIIVDNYQDRCHGRSNTWLLADASLYFLHGGDLTNVPHLIVSWDTLDTSVRHFSRDATSTSGTNPNGYMQLLTPKVAGDLPSYWKLAPEFGDIRIGWNFSVLFGGSYLHDLGRNVFLGNIQDETNWRVILRQKTPPTITPPTENTSTAPSTPSPEALQSALDRLTRKIESAKSAIREATVEHDGCDGGKRNFLESTGLFSEDEIDECFSREYEVSWTATISSSTIVTASSEHDAESLFREEHLGSYSSIDEMVIDKIHSTMTPEISIDDVSEA